MLQKEDKLMVFGIGRRKEQAPMGAPMGMPPLEPMQPGGLPTAQAMNLMQQGLTTNQVITALQRDGYSSDQIYGALNQMNMQSAGPAGMEQGMPQDMPQEQIGGPIGMPQDMQQEQMPQMPPMPVQGSAGERMEEIAERIIDEKWDELTKSTAKMNEWKEKTDSTIERMQQQIEDLRKVVENLQKAIIGKIEEYDQNLTNVGTEIKAMEKVFQKILPTFTDNVSELARLTKDLRKK